MNSVQLQLNRTSVELTLNGAVPVLVGGRSVAEGPPGADGLSAYQIAVNNGFVGTEEEWLESLVGDGGGGGPGGPTDWDDIENKPEFAAVAFSGDYNSLNNLPSLFSGNYGDLGNLPVEFPPQAHTHNASDIDDFDDAVANSPAVQANTAKVSNATHSGDVVGDTVLTIGINAVSFSKMQNVGPAVLLGRQNSGAGPIEAMNPAAARGILNVQDGATANSSDAALRDRSTHTGDQAIATVTGLQTALDAKQATAQKDVAGGYAGLDGSGKINPSQLPAIAITDRFVVASEAAMLALTAETGDIAIRTDISETFMLNGNPTVLANWQPFLHPNSPVASVFGRTGTVTAQNGDYNSDQVTEGSTNLYHTPARVLGTALSGYAAAGSRTALLSTDTTVGAFGKIGKWFADFAGIAWTGSASDLSAGTVPAARMPAHTGDATSSSGSVALTLATVNSNVGSFGLAGSVAQIAVNAKGLITAVANVAISIAASAISDASTAGRAMLTATNVAAQTALLDTFTATLKGLVPAPGSATGKFLRDDGTWAAPAAAGGAGPDKFVYFTDFQTTVADQVTQGFVSNGANTVVAWPFAGNPSGSGFIRQSLVANTGVRAAWGHANNAVGLYLRQGLSLYQTRGSLMDLGASRVYECNLGFVNDHTAAPTYGCFFRYQNGVNGGRWEAICVAGGSSTVADTGITAVINTMTIFAVEVNAAGTSVAFKINGTTVATITTNIPAAGINLGFTNAIRHVSGTAAVNAALWDYQYVSQEFTGR
jgi:hypothetical protein